MGPFKKWDILYASKFPESVTCPCGKELMVSASEICIHCKRKIAISNIIPKIRPIILWIDQDSWYKSMAFGIPLTRSNPATEDKYNQPIFLPSYSYIYKDAKYHAPMRAVITHATRVDGNVFHSRNLIGRITDTLVQRKLDNKMLDWLFSH